MYTAIVALSLVLQQSSGPVIGSWSNSALDRLSEEAQADAFKKLMEKAADRDAELQEREFVQRFNELALAMGQFSKKYKSGHVIDVKAVQSIKKAYRNLEKADLSAPSAIAPEFFSAIQTPRPTV